MLLPHRGKGGLAPLSVAEVAPTRGFRPARDGKKSSVVPSLGYALTQTVKKFVGNQYHLVPRLPTPAFHLSRRWSPFGNAWIRQW